MGNQNCIKTDNIKKVRFYNFGNVGNGNRFNDHKFEKLLSGFPNAEYLGLINVAIVNANINVAKLKKSYPKLKGLYAAGGSRAKNNEMVNAFGNQLQYLCHSHLPGAGTDFSNINFGNLQQILLTIPNSKTITDILKTGKNIKKIRIFPGGYAQEFKSIIPEIFQCETLQYFEITANKANFVSIMDGIEIGLYQTKDVNREQLKIRVNVQSQSCLELKDKMLNIQRIINMLHVSNEEQPPLVQQFMFVLDLNRVKNKDNQKKILQENLDVFSSNIQIKFHGFVTAISNKECSINGWKETFLMDLY